MCLVIIFAGVTLGVFTVQAAAAPLACFTNVDVQGIQIIDPAEVSEIAAPGQGHLHYQVDNGPTISTTAKKLSFHGLTKGSHTIRVVLAGNDHKPLGPHETLTVDIP